MFFSKRSPAMPAAGTALPGRRQPLATAETHFLLSHPLKPPYPDGFQVAYLALGCFWGAERVFWKLPGVWTTSVGYQGGVTENATYDEVCTGKTGHTEVVCVVFDPSILSYAALLKTFWESHDPTQGYRQGNDIGTQYRSAIFTTNDAQLSEAEASRALYAAELAHNGYGAITTEIKAAPPFYFAEAYHQQYLAKVPGGYCGLGGTGVSCPVGHKVT
ncbi:MAG: peptide-methionine (S)-S-oxide reductase MsrA [Hyphomicrobium sp.]